MEKSAASTRVLSDCRLSRTNLEDQAVSKNLLEMPIVNGDVARDAAPVLSPSPVEDHATALKILEKEYSSKDGIDIHTLLDSCKNGGLTYNDFLVLPGYIGIDTTPEKTNRAGKI